jgi:hypothetical protein
MSPQDDFSVNGFPLEARSKFIPGAAPPWKSVPGRKPLSFVSKMLKNSKGAPMAQPAPQPAPQPVRKHMDSETEWRIIRRFMDLLRFAPGPGLTQHQLAAEVGMDDEWENRAAVYRVLRRMARRGFVEVSGYTVGTLGHPQNYWQRRPDSTHTRWGMWRD